MYVYEIRYLPTKEFYVGYDTESVTLAQAKLDPYNKFKKYGKGSNAQLPLPNIVKTVLFKGGNEQELRDYLTTIAKDNENNPFFLGVHYLNMKNDVIVKTDFEPLKTKENKEIVEPKKEDKK